jgi:hypothetical protein
MLWAILLTIELVCPHDPCMSLHVPEPVHARLQCQTWMVTHRVYSAKCIV